MPGKKTFKGISIFKGGFTNPPCAIAKTASMPMPLSGKISACFHCVGEWVRGDCFKARAFGFPVSFCVVLVSYWHKF